MPPPPGGVDVGKVLPFWHKLKCSSSLPSIRVGLESLPPQAPSESLSIWLGEQAQEGSPLPQGHSVILEYKMLGGYWLTAL